MTCRTGSGPPKIISCVAKADSRQGMTLLKNTEMAREKGLRLLHIAVIDNIITAILITIAIVLPTISFIVMMMMMMMSE